MPSAALMIWPAKSVPPPVTLSRTRALFRAGAPTWRLSRCRCAPPRRLHSSGASVADWRGRGPDWQQRGRSNEELYVAAHEARLMATAKAERQAAKRQQVEGLRMEPEPEPELTEQEGGSLAVELFEKLLAAGVDGKSKLQLSSSADLAAAYREDDALPTVEDKVTSIIRWESSKGFASGFVTGSGGVFALPVALPAAVWASWTLQARLNGAIAEIHGFDSQDDFTRTCVMMSLLDTWSPWAGVAPTLDSPELLHEQQQAQEGKHEQVTRKLARELLFNGRFASAAIMGTVQRHVGNQILRRVTARTIPAGAGRAVPIVSGFIGGSLDARAMQLAGRSAHSLFSRIAAVQEEEEQPQRVEEL